ncbi:MAG: TlpA disulfide reductase family protein [Roseibium sp.]
MFRRRDFIAGIGALAFTGTAKGNPQFDMSSLGLARPPMAIEAPVLDVPDLDGSMHRTSDYHGKVVLVSFWATWCPPCRKEMPSLARLSRDMPSEAFAVLAVNVGDKKQKVQTFLNEIDHEGLSVLLDSNSVLPSRWFIRGLPVSYLLDRNGSVAYGAIGGREWDAPKMKEGLLSLV